MQIVRWKEEADTLRKDVARGVILSGAKPHFESDMGVCGIAASHCEMSFHWSNGALVRHARFVTTIQGINRHARIILSVPLRPSDDFPQLRGASDASVLDRPFFRFMNADPVFKARRLLCTINDTQCVMRLASGTSDSPLLINRPYQIARLSSVHSHPLYSQIKLTSETIMTN